MSDSQQPQANDNHDDPELDPEIAAILDFEPVPRRFKKEDGWTAALQKAFIAHLAKSGSPGRACDALGKRRSGIDKLYKDPVATSFRAAWAKAVEIAERRQAERIVAEHKATANLTAPFVDHRRKAPSPGPSDHPLPQRGEGPALPVICDRCGAEGLAGDEDFAGIPDILAFDPVPRAAHDKLWDAETQRAFIAALAVSGSPVRAARSVGRHAFGAEKLRKARGARGFNEAWEAAMDLARERELARLHGKLDQLASPSPAGGEDDGQVLNEFGEYEDSDSFERRAEEARASIFAKLERLRKRELLEIKDDPEKRAAWVVLYGEEEIEAVENGTWEAAEWESVNAENKTNDGAADA